MAALEFTGQPEFIQDGHWISFVLDREEVKIAEIHCPNVGTTSLCNRRRTFCVVERFLDAYGIDLNLGRVHLDGKVEIAWCPVHGEESDLDVEFDSVWIVPIKDPDYRLMMEERDAVIQAAGMDTQLPAIEAAPEDQVDEDYEEEG